MKQLWTLWLGAMVASGGFACGEFDPDTETGVFSLSKGRPTIYKVGGGGPAQGIAFVGVGAANQTRATPYRSGRNPIIGQYYNVYAPSVLRLGPHWYIYYGGYQDTQHLHDRILLAVAQHSWEPWRNLNLIETPLISINPNGFGGHVNDPSVIILPENRRYPYHMLYTLARGRGSIDADGEIHYAYSADAATWSPSHPWDGLLCQGGTRLNIVGTAAIPRPLEASRPSLTTFVQSSTKRLRVYFDGTYQVGGPYYNFIAEAPGLSFCSPFTLVKRTRVDTEGINQIDVRRKPDGTYIRVGEGVHNCAGGAETTTCAVCGSAPAPTAKTGKIARCSTPAPTTPLQSTMSWPQACSSTSTLDITMATFTGVARRRAHLTSVPPPHLTS
jgi:hypothetical protein